MRRLVRYVLGLLVAAGPPRYAGGILWDAATQARLDALRAELNLSSDPQVIVWSLACLEVLAAHAGAGGDVVLRDAAGRERLFLLCNSVPKEPA